MKKNKILLCFMLLVMVFGVTIPSLNSVSAEDSTSRESLITKADPYVYLDQKTEQFKLVNKAEKALTSKELSEVKEILADTNSQVKEHRSDLVITKDKFISNQDRSGSDSVTTSAIDKSLAFDWDFTWWGLKVYWSHKFVLKLKSNILIYGAGTAALNATISYFLSPPGWVTSFVSAVAGIGLWSFIKQDAGCGVYLDCYAYVPSRWYSAC
ncbi:hypothetical protein FC682_20920 [Peribacillus simplex]|uniref:hypothetical protein n=1 Tax=Peribacillus simplex TaxID=1478 RepID=UPI0010BE8AD6|nr:hypothetical protein [Peribacillus simplex]TKH02732.1 hypothetical protein FC682_20920 [Peribacillus simplex]